MYSLYINQKEKTSVKCHINHMTNVTSYQKSILRQKPVISKYLYSDKNSKIKNQQSENLSINLKDRNLKFILRTAI